MLDTGKSCIGKKILSHFQGKRLTETLRESVKLTLTSKLIFILFYTQHYRQRLSLTPQVLYLKCAYVLSSIEQYLLCPTYHTI